MARGTYYPRTCEVCGTNFKAGTAPAKFCIDCRPDAYRASNRLYWKNQYRTNPTAVHARQRAWIAANPERFRAIQRRCYRRPCVLCGNLRWRGRTPKDSPFTCGDCKRKERWDNYPTKACRLCQLPIARWPSTWGKVRRPWCTACRGLQLQVSKEVGLTRERIRQLMEEEYRRLVRATRGTNGNRPTHRDALENVWRARTGAATHARLEKRGPREEG